MRAGTAGRGGSTPDTHPVPHVHADDCHGSSATRARLLDPDHGGHHTSHERQSQIPNCPDTRHVSSNEQEMQHAISQVMARCKSRDSCALLVAQPGWATNWDALLRVHTASERDLTSF